VAARLGRGLSPMRLRLILGALFAALALPTLVLVVETQRQLKWEAFHQYRTLADEFGLRVDVELQRLVAAEEARGYGDYGFVVVGGDPAASNFLALSPLARFPVQSEIPGAIGYFQIAADGTFSTPLLPSDPGDAARWGIDDAELARRAALRDSLFAVLSRNRLASRDERPESGWRASESLWEGRKPRRFSREPAMSTCQASSSQPPPEPQRENPTGDKRTYNASQAAFDELNAPAGEAVRQQRTSELGRVDDLKLDKALEQKSADQDKQQEEAPAYEQRLKANVPSRQSRKERAAVVEGPAAGNDAPATIARSISTFESELDPFDFSLLDDAHGVFFRKVWRDGQRTIQGVIVDRRAFLDGAIVVPFRETAIAALSDLVVAYRDDVLEVAHGTNGGAKESAPLRRASEVEGELLHQLRLSAPLGDFELLWKADRLPSAPGARVVTWASLVLGGVLLVGIVVLYRLGLREILRTRQQQDFVSAVSHELKTPLTSIRMYAEMLREGWALPEKQREYYGFIHDESERLSRLIANVLELARMERNELVLEPKPHRVAALMDIVRSKVHTQVERAGFAGTYTVDPACAEHEVRVDADAFAQIVINLVDNALKFAAKGERRALEIGAAPHGANAVVFTVRDYGPGVERAQMQKIFRLFYRPGSELTRETLGTGIGLALVRQLARAMGGDADVVNREPGAEFRVTLPLA